MLIISVGTRSAATGRIVETSSGRPVDDALRQPEESTKLNRRSLRLPHSTVTLRESLETLEHAAVTFRVFARSLVDSTRLADEDNPLPIRASAEIWPICCGNCPRRSGRTGASRPSSTRPSHDLLESELERHLAAVHDDQDRLSELLGKPDGRPRRRLNRVWRGWSQAA
jgi:hypothetical protein